MPRPTRELQLEYQRKWMAARRASYFAGKCCVWCGSVVDLELDHIDIATKVHHQVWSWSQKRRDAELLKCRVLCERCHTKRHADERRKPLIHGTTNAYKKRRCRCELCRAANTAQCRNRPARLQRT